MWDCDDLPESKDSLSLARAEVEERRKEPGGIYCPCCGLYNKFYKRKLNAGMALCLLIFCRYLRINGKQSAHVREIKDVRFHRSREFAKLRYWGLVVEDEEDTSTWSVTQLGWQFAHGRIEVPRHVYVFDDKCKGINGKESIGVRKALGDLFDYEELMRGWFDAEC